jgi:hypothetical protein
VLVCLLLLSCVQLLAFGASCFVSLSLSLALSLSLYLNSTRACRVTIVACSWRVRGVFVACSWRVASLLRARCEQAPLEEQCWKVAVQKCQYCVGSGDTLAIMMKEYVSVPLLLLHSPQFLQTSNPHTCDPALHPKP